MVRRRQRAVPAGPTRNARERLRPKHRKVLAGGGMLLFTFATQRTNVLLGAVHLLLFLTYLMLMFER